MDFTYDWFINLITKLKRKGFNFIKFKDNSTKDKIIYMRHDVDLSLDKALEMAVIEKKLNIKSTYFLLVSSNFYNIFSKENSEKIQSIINCGHEIGLHFDEKRYQINSKEEFKKLLLKEKLLMEKAFNIKINSFSNHRPSRFTLNTFKNDLAEMNNAYSKKFFKDKKYISDSRMKWRENIDQYIDNNEYESYQICIHPFWYSNEEKSMEKLFEDFFKIKKNELYSSLTKNIHDFQDIIRKEIEN